MTYEDAEVYPSPITLLKGYSMINLEKLLASLENLGFLRSIYYSKEGKLWQ